MKRWWDRRGRDEELEPQSPLEPESPSEPELPIDSLLVRPLTMARVAELIRAEGYSCEDDGEGEVRGIWNEVGFRFFLSPDDTWLGISTVWEAPDDFPVGMHSALQEASNDWNRQFLQPTAYPSTDEDKIVFFYSVFVDAGLSDQQFSQMLDRALDVNLQAHRTIASLLPPVL
ncbi:YbjN domain-containing protein [Scrofimicrobium sp. R131]|uniref:YbjN domain-containing protein n=1 Tax=Scrofimicrobium appendicitidis TaxID=3079930 RepID=A0AAU7V597_9ACTO